MKYLNNEELYNIEGGAVKFGILVAVGATIAFLVGVFAGYSNPIKCNVTSKRK